MSVYVAFQGAHLDIISSQCHKESTGPILQIKKLKLGEVTTCQKLWTVEVEELLRAPPNPSGISSDQNESLGVGPGPAYGRYPVNVFEMNESVD